MLARPVFQYIEKVDCLLALIHGILVALVWVKAETVLHHSVEVKALVNILVNQFYSINVAMNVLE